MTPDCPNILSPLLPTADETLLLRACLYSGESGRRAWWAARELWEERARLTDNELENGRRACKTLWPLLLNAMERNGVVLDRALLTLLRTAYLREELRSTIYRRICKHVLTTLATADIPVIVLNGAALAEEVYYDPVLRHCHDIDLLVKEKDQLSAKRLLCSEGFKQASDAGWCDLKLDHPSGLPVELHTGFTSTRKMGLWSRSRSQVVSDIPTRVLSPIDHLLYICGHASCHKIREPLRWVCDAWLVVHRYPDLDWTALLQRARQTELSVPLVRSLRYLAEDLQAPVPLIL